MIANSPAIGDITFDWVLLAGVRQLTLTSRVVLATPIDAGAACVARGGEESTKCPPPMA